LKCRRCNIDKDVSMFYKSTRNKTGLEYICKPCKSIDINARRYGVSESFIEYLYSHEHCMCCGEKFVSNKQRHIHHTDDGVQGLICLHCNHILGQETKVDLQRINQALTYIKSTRENLLDRDNQQERLRVTGMASKHTEESSETIRCESKKCSQCKRFLTKESFCTRIETNSTRNVCWDCGRSNDRLSYSKQAIEARNKSSNCACCGCELIGKKCVHHVGDTVYGVVCNKCNQVLGNESEQRKMRLLACKLWIEATFDPTWIMIESGLHGDMQR